MQVVVHNTGSILVGEVSCGIGNCKTTKSVIRIAFDKNRWVPSNYTKHFTRFHSKKLDEPGPDKNQATLPGMRFFNGFFTQKKNGTSRIKAAPGCSKTSRAVEKSLEGGDRQIIIDTEDDPDDPEDICSVIGGGTANELETTAQRTEKIKSVSQPESQNNSHTDDDVQREPLTPNINPFKRKPTLRSAKGVSNQAAVTNNSQGGQILNNGKSNNLKKTNGKSSNTGDKDSQASLAKRPRLSGNSSMNQVFQKLTVQSGFKDS